VEQEVLDRPISTEAVDDWPEEKKLGALRMLIRHRELVQALTFRDIRSRYKQSVLGIAWALLQPLAMTVVFTIVMTRIARIPTGGIPAPIFIYIAMLPWTFFSQGLTTGTECLVSNFNLITKIYFPREAFPISAVLGRTVDLGLGTLVIVPLFVFYHIHATWLILLVVPVLIIQVCLLIGLTFVLSSANLFYRDIRHVVPLLTQVWMYMSPIIYGLESVPKKYLSIYMLNPLAPIMDTYRRVALQGEPPMWSYLGLAAVVSVVTLVVGYRIFKRLDPAFAEII
jgi:ABC-type polysaccharide/polyol phosphate export permease